MSKAAKIARPAPRAKAGPSFEYLCGWAGALALLAAMVYAPTFANGFIWDDGQHVVNNANLDSAQGLVDIWFTWGAIPQYYPLVHTTFWVEHQLWGDDPRGYHVINVLLHALSAVLLWRLLERLEVPGAWLAAALFAVHPINVESVAWISERKNVLSLALALASMLMYLRYVPPAPEGTLPAPRGDRWLYIAALAFYILALFSKTVTASVPAVLLVIYWWKQGRFGWRELGPLLPFFAVGVALGSVTVWQERTHVGASGGEFELTPAERILVAGRAAWFYAGKLLWPYPLIFFYPRWTIDPSAAWQYAYPAAAVLLLVVLWAARKRIGRGPLAAALIFGGVLVPALGFFNLYPFRYSFVADHFQYHAGIALIVLVTAVAVRFARLRLREVPWAGFSVGLIVCAALAVMAHNYCYVFRNLQTLYEDVLAKNPGAWNAHANLGDYLIEQGQPAEALEHYQAAAQKAPKQAAWQSYLSVGNALQDLRRPQEALEPYRQALEAAPEDMQAIVHLNLASALAQSNRNEEALDEYRQALSIDPKCLNATTETNFAVCLAAAGHWDEAIVQFRKALEHGAQPAWAIRLQIAECLEKLQKHSEAIAEYRQVASQRPDQLVVGNRVARVLLASGNPDAAAAQLLQNLRQPINAPLRAEALELLGVARLAQGNEAEAIKLLNQSIRVAPQRPSAHLVLTQALSAAGDPAGAEDSARNAIALQPTNPDAHYQLGALLERRGETSAAAAAYEAALKHDPRHKAAAAALEKLKSGTSP